MGAVPVLGGGKDGSEAQSLWAARKSGLLPPSLLQAAPVPEPQEFCHKRIVENCLPCLPFASLAKPLSFHSLRSRKALTLKLRPPGLALPFFLPPVPCSIRAGGEIERRRRRRLKRCSPSRCVQTATQGRRRHPKGRSAAKDGRSPLTALGGRCGRLVVEGGKKLSAARPIPFGREAPTLSGRVAASSHKFGRQAVRLRPKGARVSDRHPHGPKPASGSGSALARVGRGPKGTPKLSTGGGLFSKF